MRQKLTPEKRRLIIKLVKAGENVADLAAMNKVSRENVYGLCRRAGVKIPKKPSKTARLRSLKEIALQAVNV